MIQNGGNVTVKHSSYWSVRRKNRMTGLPARAKQAVFYFIKVQDIDITVRECGCRKGEARQPLIFQIQASWSL